VSTSRWVVVDHNPNRGSPPPSPPSAPRRPALRRDAEVGAPHRGAPHAEGGVGHPPFVPREGCGEQLEEAPGPLGPEGPRGEPNGPTTSTLSLAGTNRFANSPPTLTRMAHPLTSPNTSPDNLYYIVGGTSKNITAKQLPRERLFGEWFGELVGEASLMPRKMVLVLLRQES